MTTRRNDHMSIKAILKDFVESNNLEKGLDKVNVAKAWNELMGNGVNKYTTEIYLEKETLYIHLSSSVLREELGYGKQKIINLLNEELGKEVIKKLILR